MFCLVCKNRTSIRVSKEVASRIATTRLPGRHALHGLNGRQVNEGENVKITLKNFRFLPISPRSRPFRRRLRWKAIHALIRLACGRFSTSTVAWFALTSLCVVLRRIMGLARRPASGWTNIHTRQMPCRRYAKSASVTARPDWIRHAHLVVRLPGLFTTHVTRRRATYGR